MTMRNETERTIDFRREGDSSTSISVTLDGDSLWRSQGRFIGKAGEIVNVESITIREYDIDDEHYFDVYVRHDADWTIYTDSGFERNISNAIGHEVRWSEQGMQEDGIAHLEA